jgi:hypothetical protein
VMGTQYDVSFGPTRASLNVAPRTFLYDPCSPSFRLP